MDIYCHEEIILHIWLRLRALTVIEFIGGMYHALRSIIDFTSVLFIVLLVGIPRLGNWQ